MNNRRDFLRSGLIAAAAANVPWRIARGTAPATEASYPGIWPSEPPAGCPVGPSSSIKAVRFTGRHQEYANADTWYPSWATDGNLYSSFADGNAPKAGGGMVNVNCGLGAKADVGYARISGDNPLHLQVEALGLYKASAMPWGGRYPCANLVYNDVWYYGTYSVDIGWRTYEGVGCNWAWLGPFVGFQYSRDLGKTWTPSPRTPWQPLFAEEVGHFGPALKKLVDIRSKWPVQKWLGNVPGSALFELIPGLPLPKFSVLHVVDFGQNMQHSPDGMAYMVGHGRAPHIPHPRLGAVSWLSGDAVYLARVRPTPETINDASHYEFFAGYDHQNRPVWSRHFSHLKPMLEWPNHLGNSAMSYIPGLKKYILCIADGWPSTRRMNTIMLESSHPWGPWKLVTYLRHFGEQGYFVNIPSKFISADGRKLWLCYSANFTGHIPANPPGSGYHMCLQEIELIG